MGKRTNRRRIFAAVLAVALIAGSAGCTSSGETVETPTATTTTPPGTQAEDTLLLRALAGITGPTDGYVEFGDAATLRELSGGEHTGTWGDVRPMGFGGATSYWQQMPETIGVDPDAADYAITVAQAPGSKTLITGGQDEATVRAVAEAAGWQGDPVLSSELNPEQPLSVYFAAISPAGSDVLLAGRDAASGSGPAADEEPIRELAECLGGVVAAMFADGVAVGVRPDADESPVAVYCVDGGEGAAAEIEQALADGTTHTGQTYSELFPEREFEIVGDHARFELSGPDASASLIIMLLMSRDLPGARI